MPSEVMSMQEPDNPVIPGPGLLSTGRYIHFGPFRIDQQRQEVTRNGARLKLQGKVYQTLLTLLEKPGEDRKSTRLNSSHGYISYAVFCLKKKKNSRD